MQKINRTYKTLRRRFIHTYDNTCVTTSVVDVTIYLLSTSNDVRRSPSDMFRGVLNTKNHPCSRSNMVEMVCFLRWYCNRKYKYRHRRTLLQIFHWFVHLGTFETTIFRLACSGNRKRLWPCASYESAL